MDQHAQKKTDRPRGSEEIHADHPRPGWYRMRRYRNGPWLPVCIWYETVSAKLVARVADKMEDPNEIWTYCADKQASPEEAKFAFAHGRWPSEPEPIPGLTNLPADPYDALLIEVEEHVGRANQWINQHAPLLKTQADADMARHLQVEIQELKKRADDLHKAEKAPNIKEGKWIDNRYRFREDLDAGNKALRNLVTEFLKSLSLEQLDAALDAELLAKPRAGGMVGKRAGLATVWRAEVVDYQLAAAHFIGHPDLKAVVLRLANHAVRDAKGAITIPGVTNIEDQVAR